ncbi:MAG: FAD-binding oxidoreductase [Dehalococcoidia bacterium]
MVIELSGPQTVRVQEPIETLRLRLRGELIQPGHASYDPARIVHWGSIDRRPALIVRAEDEVDVIAAVDFARETGTPLAIRSGGHGFAGHGMVDGGIVVDMSGMKSMRIDPVRRTARVQPGLNWGEYAEQAHAYGLATSSGDVATVGVGGLTAGGGIGWMARKYGLTIDHLISAEIVTADGRLVRASENEHPDLFWAVRGGGGNFGVITSLEFRLEPAGTILGGGTFYPAADAANIIRAAADYAAQAPDELTTMVMVMHAPPLPFIPAEQVGKLAVLVAFCYVGDLAEGERVVAPLRTLGEPIVDMVMPMPYPGMFELTRDLALPGRRLGVRSMYLESLTDDAIETVIGHTGAATSPFAMAQLRVLGGAMARVPADATAFGHRDKQFMLSVVTEWEDPAEDEQQQAWTERFYAALRPHAAGVYVNFLADEGEARVREAYKAATYERLAAVKAQYDPTNLFRQNQNIKPA